MCSTLITAVDKRKEDETVDKRKEDETNTHITHEEGGIVNCHVQVQAPE